MPGKFRHPDNGSGQLAAQVREYLFTPSALKLDKFFRGRAALGRVTRRLHGVEEGNLSA